MSIVVKHLVSKRSGLTPGYACTIRLNYVQVRNRKSLALIFSRVYDRSRVNIESDIGYAHRAEKLLCVRWNHVLDLSAQQTVFFEKTFRLQENHSLYCKEDFFEPL